MSLKELERIGNGFYFNDEDVTGQYYSGTHQIILTGDCVDVALDALEDIDNVTIFFYDDDYHCYIVAPDLSEVDFFEQIVSVVESAVADIFEEDGSYTIRCKIPTTPKLPDQGTADIEQIDGASYYKATIHLGRGYGTVYSVVDIFMSVRGRKVLYRVQRFINSVTGAEADGEAKIFSGMGAQWQAVCFAYDIEISEGDSKEAAQRAKKFVYAIVGELMSRFWSTANQPSYLRVWERSKKPVLITA